MTHRIDSVHFERGTNDGDLVCSCGEQMLASEFRLHHGPTGGNPTIGKDQAYKPITHWNTSLRKRRKVA